MADATSERVPTPALVAAWEALGMLPAESVPMWAAYWVADGQNGDALVALAGLSATDIREVHDLLPEALRELGIEPMTERAAAARLTFDHIARMVLAGKGGWRWAISAVVGTFEQNGHATDFYEEPLGALYGLDDELHGAWGRSAEDLELAVWQACERQAALTN